MDTPARADPSPPRRLVLASASPSRLALLRTAGFDPQVIASGVAEDDVEGLSPIEAARTLAERKAHAVADRLAASDDRFVVVGCDSLLSIDGRARGKPRSEDEARAWWRSQRGRVGTLATGHCVVAMPEGRRSSGVTQTEVRFGNPTDDEIEAYLATGEPLQVAGAATIDGYGGPFIDGIDGDHGAVIGLSLPLLRRLLADVGIRVTDLWAGDP